MKTVILDECTHCERNVWGACSLECECLECVELEENAIDIEFEVKKSQGIITLDTV